MVQLASLFWGDTPGSSIVFFERDASPAQISRWLAIESHSHNYARVLLNRRHLPKLDSIRETGDSLAFADASGDPTSSESRNQKEERQSEYNHHHDLCGRSAQKIAHTRALLIGRRLFSSILDLLHRS